MQPPKVLSFHIQFLQSLTTASDYPVLLDDCASLCLACIKEDIPDKCKHSGRLLLLFQ